MKHYQTLICIQSTRGSYYNADSVEVRPSSVAPDPAESRGAPPPPQDPSPLRGTLGSSLRSPEEGEGAGTLGVPLEGTRRVGGLLGVAGRLSGPGSSVHGILQVRILEWVAMPSSRGSSQPRDGTHVSYISCTGRSEERRVGKEWGWGLGRSSEPFPTLLNFMGGTGGRRRRG